MSPTKITGRDGIEREIHRLDISKPEDEATWLAMRSDDITSTEISALFGLSPYETKFELWHRKKGHIPSRFEDNEVAKAGRFLEASIARLVADDHGATVRPKDEYIRIPSLKIGCSFDWEWRNEETGAFEPFEIKLLRYLVFRDQWKTLSGEIEAPFHIALQHALQQFASDTDFGRIGYFAGSDTWGLVEMPRHPAAIEKILRAVSEFWESVEANREPDPDFERDGDVLRLLYSKPDPRAALPAEKHASAMDAITRATAAAAEKKTLETAEKSAKAELMKILEEVEVAVLPDGSKVSWKANAKGSRVMRLTAAKSEE